MFGIGWHVLRPKGNIIAPIVFITAKKKTPKIRGSFCDEAESEVHVEGDPCHQIFSVFESILPVTKNPYFWRYLIWGIFSLIKVDNFNHCPARYVPAMIDSVLTAYRYNTYQLIS